MQGLLDWGTGSDKSWLLFFLSLLLTEDTIRPIREHLFTYKADEVTPSGMALCSAGSP